MARAMPVMMMLVMVVVMMIGTSMAVAPRGFPEIKPPECKQEVPEGVVRSAEEISKDLPDGCSLELKSADERAKLGENDDVAEVKCDGRSNQVSFIDKIGKWGWPIDGNCCCPAYEYERCPNQVYSNGQWWPVVQDGPIFGAQCWTEAYCGWQNGICLGQCKPVTRTINVLVHNPPFWFRWVPVRYPASCACYDCDGEPCNNRIIF